MSKSREVFRISTGYKVGMVVLAVLVPILGLGLAAFGVVLLNHPDSGAKFLGMLLSVAGSGASGLIIALAVRDAMLEVEVTPDYLRIGGKLFSWDGLRAEESRYARSYHKRLKIRGTSARGGYPIRASLDDRLEGYDYVKEMIAAQRRAA